MLDNKQIYEESLVNHIFFAGTIRRFCTVIGLTFFRNNQDYINRAIELGYRATDIINPTLEYMNSELAREVLLNGVYITKYSKNIDILTEQLFGVNLLSQIDKDINILNTRGEVVYDDLMMGNIYKLNMEAIKLVNDFKEFCLEIKTKLNTQELFSYLYSNIFDYMYNELSVYGRDLQRIISKMDYTDFYLSEYTYYFNNLLRDSALYIRGFLDTIYQDIFDIASFYVDAFSDVIESYLKNKNDLSLNNRIYELVSEYKVFIVSIIERLLNDKISLITPPVLLDNFLMNVNVYLFILKYAKKLDND